VTKYQQAASLPGQIGNPAGAALRGVVCLIIEQFSVMLAHVPVKPRVY
jgi:hypothetical protein